MHTYFSIEVILDRAHPLHVCTVSCRHSKVFVPNKRTHSQCYYCCTPSSFIQVSCVALDGTLKERRIHYTRAHTHTYTHSNARAVVCDSMLGVLANDTCSRLAHTPSVIYPEQQVLICWLICDVFWYRSSSRMRNCKLLG